MSRPPPINRTDTHDPAHTTQHPAATCRIDQRLVLRQPRKQRLHLLRGSFRGEKIENDADRFFRDRMINTDLRHYPVDQRAHHPPDTFALAGELADECSPRCGYD